MDFPMFHLDGMGNRMLIALIAIVHVAINHPLAVGIYPLLTLLEWLGVRTGDHKWDQLAKRMTFVVFVITTSLGALTGVGIWLSTSLVSPFAIGSLLRVFFWAWFAEWLVFITEVVLILAYYLTWDRWTEGRAKRLHLCLGIAVSIFSWLTMSIIVAVLGFMMDSGAWKEDSLFWSAVLNPIYLPQLAFRTTFAMATAGLFAGFLLGIWFRKDSEFRNRAMRLISCWTLAWLPLLGLASWWYLRVVPEAMSGLIPIGLMTQQFTQWQDSFLWIAVGVLGFIALSALAGALIPQRMPRFVLIVPFLFGLALLGHFERVREFIRKPYVIADYMYSNGILVDEVAFYQKNGLLPYAAYAHVHEVTPENKSLAGRDVFVITCSRCHTTDGFNGIIPKLEKLYGNEPWDAEQMKTFLSGMHLSHPYMPPFPGNAAEADALVTYLKELQDHPSALEGVQVAGIPPSTNSSGSHPESTTKETVSRID
ncbi:cytochrome [Blastopirellula marina]|uniref:Cytochrome n=2 Tax=Pirellulales TaxID=2691354 RepID=A0A2S8F2J9_9BACT|nr:cytochrome [Blastopirellula marina]RCS44848.1 cytochrome c [Bremerella cremea]